MYLNCIYLNLTSMGPCIVIIFQYISNKMHRYTVYWNEVPYRTLHSTRLANES
jgi:hypothetical protein